MVTAGTALFSAAVLVVLAVGFWFLVSPSVAGSDRVVLAVEIGLLVLVSGLVAYVLGQVGGRISERAAGRRAVEQARLRQQREEAQIAARQAERAQIAAREAEVIRQLAPVRDEDSTGHP